MPFPVITTGKEAAAAEAGAIAVEGSVDQDGRLALTRASRRHGIGLSDREPLAFHEHRHRVAEVGIVVDDQRGERSHGFILPAKRC
jgi:hypothetical protein